MAKKKKSTFKKFWDFYFIGIGLTAFLIMFIMNKIFTLTSFYLIGLFSLLAIMLLTIGFIGLIINAIKNKNKRKLRITIIITIIIIQILLIMMFVGGMILGGILG